MKPGREIRVARLRILSLPDADRVLREQRCAWDVLTVGTTLPNTAFCRRHAQIECDDITQLSDPSDPHPRSPCAQHIHDALAFARATPEDQLIVHCHMGLSRSPAIAWCILLERLKSPYTATAAIFAMQPCAIPNRLLIQLGLEILVGHSRSLEAVMTDMRTRSQHPLRYEYLWPP